MTADQSPFEVFLEEWLADVRAGVLSTTSLGHRFARKLLCQWLDIEDSLDDLAYCDGVGDGGIDVAYLHRGDGQDVNSEGKAEGHTWYLVQGKFGTAFKGVDSVPRPRRRAPARPPPRPAAERHRSSLQGTVASG
jgi:hypothetical protein